MIDGHELYVGVSIGVAIAPHDGEDQERLLKSADIAMYAPSRPDEAPSGCLSRRWMLSCRPESR